MSVRVNSTVKVMAASFALTAYAVAIIGGLAAGNPAGPVMVRAVVAMLICYLVGLALASAAMTAIREHLEESERAHEAPNVDEILRGSTEPIEVGSRSAAPPRRAGRTPAARAA